MMSQEAVPSELPNSHLAKLIVEKMIAQGLLPNARQNEALVKIRDGKASASNWRMWVEDIVLNPGKNNEQASQD